MNKRLNDVTPEEWDAVSKAKTTLGNSYSRIDSLELAMTVNGYLLTVQGKTIDNYPAYDKYCFTNNSEGAQLINKILSIEINKL